MHSVVTHIEPKFYQSVDISGVISGVIHTDPIEYPIEYSVSLDGAGVFCGSFNMESSALLMLSLVLAGLGIILLRRRKRKKVYRQYWVRPWIARRNLDKHHSIMNLYQEFISVSCSEIKPCMKDIIVPYMLVYIFFKFI